MGESMTDSDCSSPLAARGDLLKVTQPVSGGARTQALTTRAHCLLQGPSVYSRCSWLLDKAARPASGGEGLVYTREERCFLFVPDSARNPPHGLRRVPGLAYAPRAWAASPTVQRSWSRGGSPEDTAVGRGEEHAGAAAGQMCQHP